MSKVQLVIWNKSFIKLKICRGINLFDKYQILYYNRYLIKINNIKWSRV